MIPPDATLPYQSRDGGSMEPGEFVLWDAVPEPAPRKRWTAGTIVTLMIMIVLVVAGWTYNELVPTSLAAILTFAMAVAMLKAMNDWFGVVDTTNVTCEHRVTNRRIIRTQERATPPVTQLPLLQLMYVTVRRDRFGRAKVQFNSADGGDEFGEGTVTFEGVADVPALVRLTLPMPARMNRRAKVRRGGAAPAVVSDKVGAVNEARVSIPADVELLDGEVVLWRGQPRKWERIGAGFIVRKALTLIALAVPVVVLLAAAGMLGPRWHVWHWAPTIISILWLWGGLYALTIGPLMDARRRARTTYYLTNLRAIMHIDGRSRETRSTLLDMALGADLIEQPDGTGDVRLRTGGGFDRVERAADVYVIFLEAIRAAGGPSSQRAETDQPQHVGGGVRDET